MVQYKPPIIELHPALPVLQALELRRLKQYTDQTKNEIGKKLSRFLKWQICEGWRCPEQHTKSPHVWWMW